ncbi:efflux RND transporter permease subunit [Anaerotignum propionicum]|uniref:efflux RND transporter permease subunit n=1 Tax=Anaerotignum propionicum TaxID=28446 RepID=UPI00289BAAFA|nr:efflux RND transporter permease subunit [Anaerotignum propionicum]
MNYLKTILNRPVSAILIIIAIIVFGISSLFNIQMEYFPDLEMPMELVYVTYPGADADSIEKLVTEPIEDVGETLTGINSITSSSYENYATIQFTYEYGTDLDDAYMELKQALDNITDDLPDACNTPMIMELSLSSDATISVAAESTDGNDIQDYVNDTIVPKLESLNGVAQVNVTGTQDKYLKIILNEDKMEQYNLSITTVASYIASADFELPVGKLDIGSQEVGVSANTDINWETDLQKIAIKTNSGGLIHLGDIANFMNLYEDDADSISRYNGSDSVLIDISKKSSSGTISVCNKVEETLKELKTDGIEFKIIHSTADDIMDTLIEVLKTLLIGVLFTMLVLFLFFGDIRASLIVGSSMPLSLMMAMILLNFMGISFDLMTGTGMLIALGMIVDNSIIVLESCFRMKEKQPDFKTAAMQGVKVMLLSIIASTITTIVVYAPICVTTGLSGQMNQSLCFSVIFTMLASLLSAVTVVPLFFTLIKPIEKKELFINRILDKLGKKYRSIIIKLLHKPKRTVIVAILFVIFSMGLATQLNFDLFPSNFDGSIKVEATFRSGTKLEVMDENIQIIEQELLKDANFESVDLEISGNAVNITAYSTEKCKRGSEEAVEYYTEQFKNITNMDIAVTPTGVASGLASLMSTGNNVSITLIGDDIDTLKKGASLVEDTMVEIPGVLNIKNDFSQSKTNVRVTIDQKRATNVGLSPATAALQVYYLLNGVIATTIEQGDEKFDVKLEYPEGRYNNMSNLMDKTISAGDGSRMVLGEIANAEYTNILNTINRQDKKFMTTVTATTTSEGKYKTSAAINKAVEKIQFPDGVWQAESTVDKSLKEEMGNMGFAILTAIFLVFLVMAVQFESVRLSVMVMLCIPFSLVGSFGLMFLSGSPLSMMAMMGFLMLIGMVVNNGILLVDSTNQLRKTMPLEDALVQAGLTRLRPILMTTLTTVLSMLPMIISSNSGMAMMQGMGYVIIGGLCASTILAMFLMPPFYLIIKGEKL